MNIPWLLFNFDGRIGRLSYWMGQLLLIVAGFATLAVIANLFRFSTSGVTFVVFAFLILLFIILLTVMNLAIASKRLHDRNKSLFWFLIIFIPIIGPLWMTIEMGFLSGTPGANSFGDPQGPSANMDEPAFDADAVVSRWQAKQSSSSAQSPAPVQTLTGPRRQGPDGRPIFGRRGLT